MSIFSGIEQFGSLVSSKINSAFDASNHGFLSGNFDDFQLGVNRALGITTQVAGTPADILKSNLTKLGQGVGGGANALLTPLSYNPSFYLLAGGSILILLMVGYAMIKVGKYI